MNMKTGITLLGRQALMTLWIAGVGCGVAVAGEGMKPALQLDGSDTTQERPKPSPMSGGGSCHIDNERCDRS
ncbi:hypothetical protein [Ferrimonas pelagia]|uniref:Lipoprotein n=1 Tax=Ferrimonas pelagia TaxID=1177826 RepID=A0ABP9FCU7_9GAMM